MGIKKGYKYAEAMKNSGVYNVNKNTGKKCSEEVKARMSAAQNRPEVRAKISAALNIVFSKPEVKAKLSAAKKGIKLSEEHRVKLRGRKLTIESKEKIRKWALNGGAIHAQSFIKNPSKPQVELYNLLKCCCVSPILNYPVISCNKSIDIADPILGLAFEFDGLYWHQDKEADLNRQSLLEEEGWKFIRYTKVPSLEQLKQDINQTQNISHLRLFPT